MFVGSEPPPEDVVDVDDDDDDDDDDGDVANASDELEDADGG